MMPELIVPVYTIDAFTRKPFGGNPAAVCIIKHDVEIDDMQLQQVATEMNLSETAFIKELDGSNTASIGKRFGLRWMTPTNEVDLCGHATLASACALFSCCGNRNNVIEFETRSGVLKAELNEDTITLDLPLADISLEVPPVAKEIAKAMSNEMHKLVPDSRLIYSSKTKKLLIRLPDHCTREDLEKVPIPNGEALSAVHDGSLIKGVIITLKAPADSKDDLGRPYDFLSRYFAHWNGIPEDPVTGSAHTVLGNYWSSELSKNEMYARQCSRRGGDVTLRLDRSHDRIYLGGPACVVLTGTLNLKS